MVKGKEMGLPSGVEVLRFLYRGEVVHIPVAPSFSHLQNAVRTVVIPALERLKRKKQPGEIIDIGFVHYSSPADTFEFKNPEAASKLIEGLRAAGLSVAVEPKKLDPIAPERKSLVPQMRERGDYYWLLDDFRDSTFIVGPVVIAEILRNPWIYDYVAEVEAARLQTESSVAVHGETLLSAAMPPRGRDRIFNAEIVSILDQAFS